MLDQLDSDKTNSDDDLFSVAEPPRLSDILKTVLACFVVAAVGAAGYLLWNYDPPRKWDITEQTAAWWEDFSNRERKFPRKRYEFDDAPIVDLPRSRLNRTIFPRTTIGSGPEIFAIHAGVSTERDWESLGDWIQPLYSASKSSNSSAIQKLNSKNCCISIVIGSSPKRVFNWIRGGFNSRLVITIKQVG